MPCPEPREEAMRRREFISLLSGAAVAWPLTAHAQQSTMPVIGFLSSAQPQVFAQMIDAFRQGLNETGYVVGQNVAFEHRAAGSEYDRFRAIAGDLVGRQVAVIFSTGGTVAALAAKDATSTIPIVFYMGGDPVKQGLERRWQPRRRPQRSQLYLLWASTRSLAGWSKASASQVATPLV